MKPIIRSLRDHQWCGRKQYGWQAVRAHTGSLQLAIDTNHTHSWRIKYKIPLAYIKCNGWEQLDDIIQRSFTWNGVNIYTNEERYFTPRVGNIAPIGSE